jgi:retron-type reverse transcriptase
VGWFLKLDVRKYFDSVPHAMLMAFLERRFKDHRLLELLNRIIAAYRGELGIGLPIGSLTSQHFANFYLGWLDRFVKESLRVRGYVRYTNEPTNRTNNNGFRLALNSAGKAAVALRLQTEQIVFQSGRNLFSSGEITP